MLLIIHLTYHCLYRALSPAKILSIKVDEQTSVQVSLKPEEVSLAIGKGGLNINWQACLLNNNEVFRDIHEDNEEDIYLDGLAMKLNSGLLMCSKN